MSFTRDEMRAWLDRRPPHVTRALGESIHIGPDATWRSWFADDGSFLGERSARRGPDAVQSAQRCACDQCRGEP